MWRPPSISIATVSVLLAQSINIPILPQASGHFLGAILLARVLGPVWALLSMFIVLTTQASLGDGGSYMTAAKTTGYDFASLVNQIVSVTYRRYFGTDLPGATRQAS